MFDFYLADAAPQSSTAAAYEQRVTQQKKKQDFDEQPSNRLTIQQEMFEKEDIQTPIKSHTFLEALENTKPVIYARIAYENYNLKNQEDGRNPDRTATAIGGLYGFETGAWNDFHVRVVFYTSQKPVYLNPTGTALANDFFTDDGSSFTYIGEANLAYEGKYISAYGGNRLIDTPFADSDDIRMVPNTFQGVWLENGTMFENFNFSVFWLSRWAGFDSQGYLDESQDVWKRFAEDSYGSLGGGAEYQVAESLHINGWYYFVEKYANMFYLEGTGNLEFGNGFGMEYGLQGAAFSQYNDSQVEGQVVGLLAMFNYEFLYAGGAYNYSATKNDNFITNGFGGGPYYTSLDEETITHVSELAPGSDVNMFRIGGGLDWRFVGLESLTTEYMFARADSTDKAATFIENDVVVTWGVLEGLDADVVCAFVDNLTDNGDDGELSFNRIVARLTYNF